jgi:hypothetical protein
MIRTKKKLPKESDSPPDARKEDSAETTLVQAVEREHGVEVPEDDDELEKEQILDEAQ